MKQRITNDKIIDALKKSSGLVTVAAKRMSCSPQTIYSRIKAFPALQVVIDENRNELVDLAEQKLKQLVKKGEFQAISLVLKTLGKHRGYIERTEIDAAVQTTENVVLYIPDNRRNK